MYYVYAIISEKDGRIYVGMSTDIKRRLTEHNSGKTRSTKAYLPWQLIFEESFATRLEARSREKYLKSGVGKEFLKGFVQKKHRRKLFLGYRSFLNFRYRFDSLPSGRQAVEATRTVMSVSFK